MTMILFEYYLFCVTYIKYIENEFSWLVHENVIMLGKLQKL